MKESSTKPNRTESITLACAAISRLLLSGGAIACFVYLLLTLASLVTVQPLFAQSAAVAAGVRLQAGIEKEDVDGDLKSAMEIYQKIAIVPGPVHLKGIVATKNVSLVIVA